jgi:hypothetical protein
MIFTSLSNMILYSSDAITAMLSRIFQDRVHVLSHFNSLVKATTTHPSTQNVNVACAALS